MIPIPVDFESFLNPMQLLALQDIEQRGWKLYFIRREGLDVPVPVVKSSDGKTIGVIDEDGNLNTSPDIKIRINPERIAIT